MESPSNASRNETFRVPLEEQILTFQARLAQRGLGGALKRLNDRRTFRYTALTCGVRQPPPRVSGLAPLSELTVTVIVGFLAAALGWAGLRCQQSPHIFCGFRFAQQVACPSVQPTRFT